MSNAAVIGFGHWGKTLIRNFHEIGAPRIVCDSDPDREALVGGVSLARGFGTPICVHEVLS
jgi:UDP-2-acetamido-3-amino-2,3-dideoxy-glucuronate N-acetyltransferase